MDQQRLFDVEPAWVDQWQGMPEFRQEEQGPHSKMVVQFRSLEDRQAFLRLHGYPTHRTKSIWFPKMPELRQSVKNAPPTTVPANRYPVYVISKGRWESRLTVKALEKLSIPYRLVVEPQERDRYASVIGPAGELMPLPFSNLGQGSIPARNWVWDHAAATGCERHWILDDNIDGFYRLHNNLKTRVIHENPFTPLETFCERYENVALAGMQYEFFAPRRKALPPFTLNTRIYSCILIRNDLPFRWRGRYNEDTDLSLRVLKAGWCTVLFNAYLCKKEDTMTMKGGNTDELYEGDGRLRMAESLREQHPDVVTVTQKWGRPQHHVNYKVFSRNKLKLKPGVVIPEGRNDYEMSLEILDDCAS